MNQLTMSYPPFPFLSLLSSATCIVSSLSKIQLFTDTSQRLILARGNLSIEVYLQTDFANLMLDFPTSIKGAVIKRQAEYLAGRYLGRLAMQQTGLFNPEPPQLDIGLLRAPAWPELVTGSITHHQYSACAAILAQPLATDCFVGVDTELWLTAEQASEIALSIHNIEEQQILVRTGFTDAQATTLLFSAKESLFKAICPFVGEYFGFEVAELKACSLFADTSTISHQSGWLIVELAADWVVAKAPQSSYLCWFSCSELDVLTLVCSDAINTQLLGGESSL